MSTTTTLSAPVSDSTYKAESTITMETTQTGPEQTKSTHNHGLTKFTSPKEQFNTATEAIVNKMQRAGLPELMIQTFCHYYEQLVAGESGYISNAEAQPVADLPRFDALTDKHAAQGASALDRVIYLKLNGGLGTSMGMQGPKSLVTVKEQQSFLDIIVNQILHLRNEYQARLPLVLMNSFNTERETLQALEAKRTFQQELPLSFLQHKEPKIWTADLWPAQWPDDPSKEWCPPGHGDLYAALVTSGLLHRLLEEGYTYAFVSNSDNLGATLDLHILGYLAENEVPFLMEVAERTPADSKGGHLAQRPDGQLILREVAQCPEEDLASFQDIERYRFFNTNNLWVHLPTLQRLLDEREGILGLPLIRNEKPVDPTQPDSQRVYQLETAMGSAIASFGGAQALVVPRSRFVPVKKNNDLLLLWSDVYQLTAANNLVVNPERTAYGYDKLPLIDLDERYYKLIEDAQARFPYGAPSLVGAKSLTVEGDVAFGRDVVIRGSVKILNNSDEALVIADGSVLEDTEVHN